MHDLQARVRAPVAVPGTDDVMPHPARPAAPASTASNRDEVRASLGGLRPDSRHPVVLVDPRPESHLAARRLREKDIPVTILTSRRLEPAFYCRSVRRHRLPCMRAAPERWEARLLELAADLEPRPILVACSRGAIALLAALHTRLSPHFACTDRHELVPDGLANAPRAEAALRRAVLRGEPALEIQIVLDASARLTARCGLAWTAGVRPDVIVTSVDAPEITDRSVRWLQEWGVVGYARLIWAPDRSGRMVLHAASVLPGQGWSLALEDGVDFPSQWYAALIGRDSRLQSGRGLLTRRIAIAEPGMHDEDLPLSSYRPGWSWRDPVPAVVGILGTLVRR